MVFAPDPEIQKSQIEAAIIESGRIAQDIRKIRAHALERHSGNPEDWFWGAIDHYIEILEGHAVGEEGEGSYSREVKEAIAWRPPKKRFKTRARVIPIEDKGLIFAGITQ